MESEIDEIYLIGDMIGEGSFGQVRKATRRSDGEKFAIKIVDKSSLETDDTV